VERAAAGVRDEADPPVLVGSEDAEQAQIDDVRRPLGVARHFGLATDHYTHFTSPIRRYSDLVVHRLALRAMADGERLPEDLRTGYLPAAAEQTSRRERVAVDAERDSVDLKKVEFMRERQGEVYDGTISGVTSFGLFVLLDRFYVEGLVHVSSLADDYYHFMENEFALLGEHRKRRFRLGDRLQVQVAAVDLERRRIDFTLTGAEPGPDPER
jgi:ribonuclease R